MKPLLTKTLIIGLCLLNLGEAYADPLLLTPAEMQKLKQYFPNKGGKPHAYTSNTDTHFSDQSHYTWAGNPITIALPLNQEKRLVFPEHVTADLKGALTADQLQLINNDKSLYLKALKPFGNTRLYVTLQDSQEVVFIDLETRDEASDVTAYINVAQNNSAPAETTQSAVTTTTTSINNTSNATSNTALSESETYVTLMRYAWQQLYAPASLLKPNDAISRAPMQTEDILSSLIYGDKVYAHPLASWQLNDTYITAIELRNKYSHSTTIHLARDICGNWIAASLYPRATLKAAGNKTADSTTLFLLSRQPFTQAMEVCHVVA